MLRDITELREAIKALERSSEAAEDTNKAKSQFLANMSHEIRTPMNAIIGMPDVLYSTPLSDEQKKYLEAITSSADSLLTIINDILDFSKIEAGKLDLEIIDFDLSQLVDEIVQPFIIQAEKKVLTSNFLWTHQFLTGWKVIL